MRGESVGRISVPWTTTLSFAAGPARCPMDTLLSSEMEMDAGVLESPRAVTGLVRFA
jgi:hypothetical protein